VNSVRVDEWMVSVLLGAWCVEWRWCVLLLACTVRCVWPCPTHPTAVLPSIAVVSCTVSCRACGVWVVCVCLWCSCGGVSSDRSPLVVVVGGGYRGWWVAWRMVGGMVSEGRLCAGLPRLVCSVPRLCVGVSLVVYPVVLLNGGACVVWWAAQ